MLGLSSSSWTSQPPYPVAHRWASQLGGSGYTNQQAMRGVMQEVTPWQNFETVSANALTLVNASVQLCPAGLGWQVQDGVDNATSAVSTGATSFSKIVGPTQLIWIGWVNAVPSGSTRTLVQYFDGVNVYVTNPSGSSMIVTYTGNYGGTSISCAVTIGGSVGRSLAVLALSTNAAGAPEIYVRDMDSGKVFRGGAFSIPTQPLANSSRAFYLGCSQVAGNAYGGATTCAFYLIQEQALDLHKRLFCAAPWAYLYPDVEHLPFIDATIAAAAAKSRYWADMISQSCLGA